jgi:hypothetical protein
MSLHMYIVCSMKFMSLHMYIVSSINFVVLNNAGSGRGEWRGRISKRSTASNRQVQSQ